MALIKLAFKYVMEKVKCRGRMIEKKAFSLKDAKTKNKNQKIFGSVCKSLFIQVGIEANVICFLSA